MGAIKKFSLKTVFALIIGAVVGFLVPLLFGKVYNSAVGFVMIPSHEESPSASCPDGDCWNNPQLGPGPELALGLVLDWGFLGALAGIIVSILLFRSSRQLIASVLLGCSVGVSALRVLLIWTFGGA